MLYRKRVSDAIIENPLMLHNSLLFVLAELLKSGNLSVFAFISAIFSIISTVMTYYFNIMSRFSQKN